MTAAEFERAIALFKRQNQRLRWKVEIKRQARQSRQQGKGETISAYKGADQDALEDELKALDYEQPSFAVPELDRVLAGTEQEVERLMAVYQL